MGGQSSSNQHPLDEHFDVNYYRELRPHFSNGQIMSIWELFKRFDPDEFGLVKVDRVRQVFNKSSDREQMRELFAEKNTIDFETFFKKFSDHLEDKKLSDFQNRNVDYDARAEDVSCFFCPYSEPANDNQGRYSQYSKNF